MKLADWLKNKPPEGYREVSLGEVMDVLSKMGYVGLGSLTVNDLTESSGHAGMPGMGGGYTPIGQYSLSRKPVREVFVRRGKIFEQVDNS